MTARIISGPRSWRLNTDDEGYREYTVIHLVEVSPPGLGPYAAGRAAGLPVTGVAWVFSTDIDAFAYCTPRKSVTIHEENEGHAPIVYRVENTFSTKPQKRCEDTDVEDPLLQPQKVSGGTNNDKIESLYASDGKIIENSSHEPVTGKMAEKNVARGFIKIVQNVPSLQLALLSSLVNCVNDAPMWGNIAGCVKFARFSWEENYYGSCNKYYTRTLEFEIDPSGFDRKRMDKGNKVLRGHWDNKVIPGTSTPYNAETYGKWQLDNIGGNPPDPTNPAHFIQYQDWSGNVGSTILDGAGKPAFSMVRTGTGTGAVAGEGEPGEFLDKLCSEGNLLLLGIPTYIG